MNFYPLKKCITPLHNVFINYKRNHCVQSKIIQFNKVKTAFQERVNHILVKQSGFCTLKLKIVEKK
jgi:hypothetical protein